MICPCCLPHPKPLQLDQNYKTRATSIRVPRATADNFLKSKLSKMGIYIWFPFLRTFMDDSIDFSKALKGSNLANKTGRKRKFVKLTQKYKFEHFFEDFDQKIGYSTRNSPLKTKTLAPLEELKGWLAKNGSSKIVTKGRTLLVLSVLHS